MFDDRNDINRPLGSDSYLDQRPLAGEGGNGWGIPLAVGAVVLVAGLLFFGSSGTDRTTTASNNVTQTNPSGPARPAPAPMASPAK